MAEAKSKGRGEECISQNLRILRGHNGKRVMLYFANSQRGALKRYVSIPRESSLFFLTLHFLSLVVQRDVETLAQAPSSPGNLNFALSGYLSKTSHSQLRGERETAQEGRSTCHD